MMAAKPIPEGFHTVSPHLVVKNVPEAIAFYKKAFKAEEIMTMHGPDGKSVMHAEVKIGDSMVMLAEEWPDPSCPKSPTTLKGTPVTLHLYVNDADKVFNQAVAAGAKVEMPMTDMFWGDRYGQVSDPFGHRWSIATHIKDLTPEQIEMAAAECFKNMGGQCKGS